jgi:sarcosine oxidase, subunit gamma
MGDAARWTLPPRCTPLEQLHQKLRQQTEAAAGAVGVQEIPFLAQISLRGDARDPAFRKAVLSTLGFDVPTKPNTVAGSPSLAALWLGPDEWLLVGDPALEKTLVPRLGLALGGLHSAVVDVSEARTTMEISGPRSRDLIMKGCSLDLHPRAFQPGGCAQTNLARANVILRLVNEAWLLHVRISFATYLATWLLDAMAEFCTAGGARPITASNLSGSPYGPKTRAT